MINVDGAKSTTAASRCRRVLLLHLQCIICIGTECASCASVGLREGKGSYCRRGKSIVEGGKFKYEREIVSSRAWYVTACSSALLDRAEGWQVVTYAVWVKGRSGPRPLSGTRVYDTAKA
ncbi:hypothetical protein EVAR_10391_1 [Eumeta japonica]|uniref:Uncharacterized protein n=1 Tax=Eumeta variegata TaxID=151549 RepID=A0A4C1UDG9_EUMVA|nr:hypothetical protein EVAR_10391_1 [Eumeta japonica]